ncbi:penicillin acylase family protein, partial [Streptomyces sp. DJ]
MPAKKKPRRARLLVIAVVVLLVAAIGGGSFWSVSTVRASFPQTAGTVKIDGLSGEVQVKRDANGIPQVYADSTDDLFRAQGYVHAQDRFWEMDVRRHLTGGRLSEMFGEDQVETDAFLRTLGWRRVAQQEYETKLSARTKDHLKAYSAGVNAYLKERSGAELSLEYAVLGITTDYEPEPWTPVDSVAWLKAMAWDLRGNMQDEIDRALMTSRLSDKQVADLYPSYPYRRNKPIVEGGSVDQLSKEYVPAAEEDEGAGGTAGQPGAVGGTGDGTGTGYAGGLEA